MNVAVLRAKPGYRHAAACLDSARRNNQQNEHPKAQHVESLLGNILAVYVLRFNSYVADSPQVRRTSLTNASNRELVGSFKDGGSV